MNSRTVPGLSSSRRVQDDLWSSTRRRSSSPTPERGEFHLLSPGFESGAGRTAEKHQRTFCKPTPRGGSFTYELGIVRKGVSATTVRWRIDGSGLKSGTLWETRCKHNDICTVPVILV